MVCVLDELEHWSESPVDGVGICPAFSGENTDSFSTHPWMVGNGLPHFPSIQAMLAETTPDVLVVSTRPDQIQPAAMLGLEAGCHLILEKPLALTLPALKVLYEMARTKRRRVMAMLSMRSSPAFVAARKIVQEGRIGQPVLVNTRKSYKWGTRAPFFNDRNLYGGTWPWIGIHNLDMAHFITNLAPVQVCASHANAAHPVMPNCEDTASGVFLLEGGVQMTASVDLCRPSSAPTHGDDWIRVVGSEGVLEANGCAGTLSLFSSSGDETQTFPIDQSIPIYRSFFSSLLGPEEAFDGTACLLTASVLAARESADTGRVITIQPSHWDGSLQEI